MCVGNLERLQIVIPALDVEHAIEESRRRHDLALERIRDLLHDTITHAPAVLVLAEIILVHQIDRAGLAHLKQQVRMVGTAHGIR